MVKTMMVLWGYWLEIVRKMVVCVIYNEKYKDFIFDTNHIYFVFILETKHFNCITVFRVDNGRNGI